MGKIPPGEGKPSIRPSALASVVLLTGLALGCLLPYVYSSPPQKKERPEKEERRRQKAMRKEMESPYKKWLDNEVPYIITDEERATFKKLSTDDEREAFIEQFWERRNPNPGSPENEFKEEYYRRIAYANEHYSSGLPGWKTDRGRIYIIHGPPDEIESHPAGGPYVRPIEEGGGKLRLSPSRSGVIATSTVSATTSSLSL